MNSAGRAALGGSSAGDIRTHDPMYGAIDVPSWLAPVLLSTEVQRLREVRLTNTSSPIFAGLSDTRRFTHSVGVLHLGKLAVHALGDHLGERERRAVLVACLVHDVGTPAFGHVFEYLLKARIGWSHEMMLRTIISGAFDRSPLYRQIYYDAPRQLHKAIRDAGVDPQLVVDIVQGQGLAGELIAGQLDLDNLDNVYRMGFMLGLGCSPENAEFVASAMTVSEGKLGFEARAVPAVVDWANTRQRCYQILALDSTSLAGQAMLTDCIEAALDCEDLTPDDWNLTDEQLLRHFALTEHAIESSDARIIIKRFAVADYYQPIVIIRYAGADDSPDFRATEGRAKLRADLESRLGFTCSPFVLFDRGAFSKDLTINSGGRPIRISSRSESTIVGVFTPTRRPVTQIDRRAARNVLAEHGFVPDRLLLPSPTDSEDPQLAFTF